MKKKEDKKELENRREKKRQWQQGNVNTYKDLCKGNKKKQEEEYRRKELQKMENTERIEKSHKLLNKEKVEEGEEEDKENHTERHHRVMKDKKSSELEKLQNQKEEEDMEVLDEDWPQREKQCERSVILVVLEEACEEVRQRVNEMTDIESGARGNDQKVVKEEDSQGDVADLQRSHSEKKQMQDRKRDG